MKILKQNIVNILVIKIRAMHVSEIWKECFGTCLSAVLLDCKLKQPVLCKSKRKYVPVFMRLSIYTTINVRQLLHTHGSSKALLLNRDCFQNSHSPIINISASRNISIRVFPVGQFVE